MRTADCGLRMGIANFELETVNCRLSSPLRSSASSAMVDLPGVIQPQRTQRNAEAAWSNTAE
jgi:hypothetical protein